MAAKGSVKLHRLHTEFLEFPQLQAEWSHGCKGWLCELQAILLVGHGIFRQRVLRNVDGQRSHHLQLVWVGTGLCTRLHDMSWQREDCQAGRHGADCLDGLQSGQGHTTSLHSIVCYFACDDAHLLCLCRDGTKPLQHPSVSMLHQLQLLSVVVHGYLALKAAVQGMALYTLLEKLPHAKHDLALAGGDQHKLLWAWCHDLDELVPISDSLEGFVAEICKGRNGFQQHLPRAVVRALAGLFCISPARVTNTCNIVDMCAKSQAWNPSIAPCMVRNVLEARRNVCIWSQFGAHRHILHVTSC